MSKNHAARSPVRILHSELSADALRGVIESFVLREGTEYGERDVAMDLKVGQVLRQLEHREAHILFDPESDSVQIMLTRDLPAGHTHPT